jgi:3-oxoacyl-[acyl-carrier-protein] synthase II
MRPAVITGLGVIGAAGVGLETLADALSEGRSLVSPMDRSAGYHAADSSRLVAAVPKVDLTPWLPPAEARRLSVPSRYAVAAARMAVADAGLVAFDDRRVAVVLATAFGALLFTEKLVRQILEEGPESAQPFYFSECVANAAAARVAIALGARGANVTITEREAGPLLALVRGAQEVREGRADIAIAGACDEMTPLLHALLDRFRATARSRPGREEAARPFDAGRDGVLAGEGAAVVVIEREDDAKARGARVLARIIASGAAFDRTAPVSDWGQGEALLAGALADALARAGVDVSSVDRVVSGASGARRGDRLEAATLRGLWGGRPLPPVLAPKAVVGEYGGGQLAASVAAVQGARFGRVSCFERPDAALGLAPHDGSELHAPRRVLVSSLAAGGAAAWTVLERP